MTKTKETLRRYTAGDWKIKTSDNPDDVMRWSKYSHWCTKVRQHAESYLRSGELFAFTEKGTRRPTHQLFLSTTGRHEFRDRQENIIDFPNFFLINGELSDFMKEHSTLYLMAQESHNFTNPLTSRERAAEGTRNARSIADSLLQMRNRSLGIPYQRAHENYRTYRRDINRYRQIANRDDVLVINFGQVISMNTTHYFDNDHRDHTITIRVREADGEGVYMQVNMLRTGGLYLIEAQGTTCFGQLTHINRTRRIEREGNLSWDMYSDPVNQNRVEHIVEDIEINLMEEASMLHEVRHMHSFRDV